MDLYHGLVVFSVLFCAFITNSWMKRLSDCDIHGIYLADTASITTSALRHRSGTEAGNFRVKYEQF